MDNPIISLARFGAAVLATLEEDTAWSPDTMSEIVDHASAEELVGTSPNGRFQRTDKAKAAASALSQWKE